MCDEGNTFRPSNVPILGNKDLLRNACACEASACSVLTDTNTPRGCPPIQSSTARLGHQIRCVCASSACMAMVGNSTGSRLDRSSGCCVVASVARLVPGHRIACDLESLVEGWYHSIASLYATQRRKQKDDLTDKTLKSAQKPERIDGETWEE